MTPPNWRQNLLRKGGGFWKNGYWYDLHVERRMPLVVPMLEEMLAALPPLDEHTSVCDLACGTGNAAFAVVSAYPMVRVTLIDEDPEMLALARAKLGDLRVDAEAFQVTVATDGEPLPGGPYDVIVASLALHAIVGPQVEGAEAETRYELLFQGLRDSLVPGGHLIVADHVGTLGLFRQMKAMERAGFADVDCAWRQDDFFVCGGRIPA
ncbi:class I SAM-dependent methyltransferase [Rhodocaloribacter litoris]|uniref:class I SAM-dependent methyltransferase n=1 Tax=Rhodocaloribacter litoris TaxID=2558931 RepID=UPI001423B413|nr:class I SAM-dependent methyltransferase [Rhodocaloribacter litoris]QXD15842.1 class I SAM-dependent methyltransferase [Rhodocaloribacter litoris]GIV57105.1 MAG: methyltransferase [Rhodothermaceae bacterium]